MRNLKMKRLFSLLPLMIIFACNTSINESVYVNDGEIKEGDIICINGSIIIGQDCKILGDCKAINGSIKIGKSSSVESIQSVNGPVYIDSNCTIKGSITAVNGEVETSSNVSILGDVSSINGNVTLENTKVSDNVKTENGDIILTASSIAILAKLPCVTRMCGLNIFISPEIYPLQFSNNILFACFA